MLHKLSDLKAAEYNPRSITNEALIGLSHSLTEFGDLSGIVFNTRTGNLVAGHQRVKALEVKYGNLEIFDLKIHAGSDTFSVRLVDWPLEREKEANILANSPTIQGTFTPDILPMLEDIKKLDPELYEIAALDDLAKLPVGIPEDQDVEFEEGSEEEQGKLDEKAKVICPECGHEFEP